MRVKIIKKFQKRKSLKFSTKQDLTYKQKKQKNNGQQR